MKPLFSTILLAALCTPSYAATPRDLATLVRAKGSRILQYSSGQQVTGFYALHHELPNGTTLSVTLVDDKDDGRFDTDKDWLQVMKTPAFGVNFTVEESGAGATKYMMRQWRQEERLFTDESANDAFASSYQRLVDQLYTALR